MGSKKASSAAPAAATAGDLSVTLRGDEAKKASSKKRKRSSKATGAPAASKAETDLALLTTRLAAQEAAQPEPEDPLERELGKIRLDVKARKALDKAHRRGDSKGDLAERGVVFVGHLPHGFVEKPLRRFFSQFGDVTRIRLSRNKKTGRSKHYAFIEFRYRDVAAIVAEAMNNYLMCRRILHCAVVPPERVHPRLWLGCKKVLRSSEVKNRRAFVTSYNAPRDASDVAKLEAAAAKRRQDKAKQLAELGIEYTLPGETDEPAPKKQKTTRKSRVQEGDADAAPSTPASGKKSSKKAKTGVMMTPVTGGKSGSTKKSSLMHVDTPMPSKAQVLASQRSRSFVSEPARSVMSSAKSVKKSKKKRTASLAL